MNYLPSLTDKATEDIWDQVRKELGMKLIGYSQLTPEGLYKKGEELQRERENAFTVLYQEVHKKAPHIREEFLKEVVEILEESPFCGNISVTGYPLSQKKLNKLMKYIGYCSNIYTDDNTHTFSKQGFSVIPDQWKEIINNKKQLEEFYKDLVGIRETQASILKQPTIHEQTGTRTKRSRQVLSLSSQEQVTQLEHRFMYLITSINEFLKQIKRPLINYQNLKDIASAIIAVGNILQEIKEEYGMYFSEEPTNNTPGLKYIDEKPHF